MSFKRCHFPGLILVGLFLAAKADGHRPQGRDVIARDVIGAGINLGIRDTYPPRGFGRLALKVRDFEVPDKDGGRYLPGRVIVRFRPGSNPSAVRAALASVGATRLTAPSYANFDVLAIDPVADPEQVARQLAARPDVQYAQPAYKVRRLFRPNDQFYSLQWNFSALDMERAWDINRGASPAIVVAVLDTGVAFKNIEFRYTTVPVLLPDGRAGQFTVDVPFREAPDLSSPNRYVAPRDFIWGDSDPVDLSGHGTHVSGTIGQLTNNDEGVAGMAFNVRIMPVKVLADEWDLIFDSPEVGTDDIVARGIRYAVDNGARILNMSLGRSSPDIPPVVEDALRYAVSRGAFVAIAAGNEYLEGNPISQPAAIGPRIDGVMTVGAVGRDLTRASYSNTGSYIEIVAPGGDQSRGGTRAGVVQQTIAGEFIEAFPPRCDVFAYEFYNGTSMAAPHVAGFAALLMQQGITKPAIIEAAIKAFAKDLGPGGRDDEYGYGLIDPRATLRGLGLRR